MGTYYRRDADARAARCPQCGKTSYRTYRIADQVSRKQPEPGRVYRGPCGRWHVTGRTRSEYDRISARERSREKMMITPVIRYYLAAAYARRGEMRWCALDLERRVPGARVVSRWHDEHPDVDHTPTSLSESLRLERDFHRRHALNDLMDLGAADVLVVHTGGGPTGGRHVELGFAIATRMRIALIGEPENVFHAYDAVEWYTTWGTFLETEIVRGELT